MRGVEKSRAIVPHQFYRGGLLASCVAVDVSSLAVAAEAAGVLGLAEKVSVDDEVPERDKTVRSYFPTLTRQSRAQQLQPVELITILTHRHAEVRPAIDGEVIEQCMKQNAA